MDLSALTLLVEIIEAGNLSQAARKLNMTRANVSYHLNQLEKAAGAQLLRRTTRRVEPTEVGLRLYQHGLSIQNELLAAREMVANLGRSLHGRVRVAVPSGYGQMVMAEWLIEFKRLYPGIVLHVHFQHRLDDLLSDEVDVAIRVLNEPPQALVAREMGSVRYIACASKDYASRHGLPRTLQELRSAPLITPIVYGRETRMSAYRGGERHEIVLEPTLISENYPFMRQAILAGLGVGFVPQYVVQDAVERGDVLTALDDYRLSIFGSQLFLLYTPHRHQTRAMRTFIDFVLEKSKGGAVARAPSDAASLPADSRTP